MAAKVGLIFGTNTGNTASVAERIAAAFSAAQPDTIEVHDLSSAGLGKLIAAGLRLSFRQSWSRPETLTRAMLEHEAVLNFIRSGDGARAEEAMRKLLQNARSDWRRVEVSRAEAGAGDDANPTR